MPLSKAHPRKHLHTRQIICFGYHRDDGLWDIEGRLTDTKTYSFDNQDRDGIQAGEPIHDMSIRLTLDDDLIIQSAEAATDASPFHPCAEITHQFDQLIGLTIGSGWRKSVIGLFGRVKGCTHLTDLLIGPLATTAMQTIAAARASRHSSDPQNPDKKPAIIDSCHALDSSGSVVERLWPNHYTGPK